MEMDSIYADRISDVPRSFIREILKVALDDTIISFAGGLPNREFFPVAELRKATEDVFGSSGKDVLQYANSEGYLPLRELIAGRYLTEKNLDIPVDNILITNGSQQGMDLLGKVLVNEGDDIIIEEPGYLGAIQAFSIFKPVFHPVAVTEEGMDIDTLKSIVSAVKSKLIYTVPNFQNPSGISYAESNRRLIAGLLEDTGMFLIEDDPYVDLRYSGSPKPSFRTFLPDNTVMLGSFSKIIAPGFRLGWIAAPDDLMDSLLIAKQATDLHTSHFTQAIVYRYLKDNDITAHIAKIREVYGKQLKAMLAAIEQYFPEEIAYTRPEGGMFLWVTLPENTSSRELLELAIKDKVIFVPGDPFYVDRHETNTLRLNFSCVDEATATTGIMRLGKAIERLLSKS